MTLQPVLCPDNPIGCDLDLVLCENENRVLVYLGVAVLERVRCTPEALDYKMLVGRLANAGWPLRKLQETFHHDPRTIKQWGAALLSDDPEFVVQAFSGRGGEGKLTVQMCRFIRHRYRQLRGTVRNYREEIAGEVKYVFGEDVSRESLRRQFRAADEETGSDGWMGSDGGGPLGPNLGADCHSEPLVSKAEGLNDNRSPSLSPPDSIPFSGETVPSRPVGVHHAGMILFVALLMRFFRGQVGQSVRLQSQWIGQVLQGAVNVEQSRLITPRDLARFTGTVVGGTDNQREALSQMSCQEAVMAVYRSNKRLLPDGPGRGRIFYCDPHTKEYTGSEKILKGWCGRRHGICKVLNMDMLHTESGLPCFCQHYSPYYDLRERFFMTLNQFDQLFEPEQRQNRVFVVDRGIYSLDTFRHFLEIGDHFLTWEKGYARDGWDDSKAHKTFVRYRFRNRRKDVRGFVFSCQESSWHRDRRIQRIIVRATNPKGRTIEVSILCSCSDMAMEDAVWLMFRRWLQENNFKYLDKHFGLNQLTAYRSKRIEESALRDMAVDSPEYRELKSGLKSKELELAKCLLKRERIQDKLREAERLSAHVAGKLDRHIGHLKTLRSRIRRGDPAGIYRSSRKAAEVQARLLKEADAAKRARQRWSKRLRKINTEIGPLKRETDALSAQLCAAIRQQSRLGLLIDSHYRLLDTRCKELFDALRIAAANMFFELVGTFRPLYDNYRDDHVMLRNLCRADGFLQWVDRTIHVRLWLRGRFQKRQRRVFRQFLAEMSDRVTQESGRTRPGENGIRITLLDTAPTW